MKKIFLLVALIATVFVQIGFAQQNNTSEKIPAILPSYYQVKDALVAGNTTLAATSAGELIKAISNADEKIVGKATKAALTEHANKIVKTKDLNAQREYFAGLSTGMIALAKSATLSAEPIYQQYCPMKKSSWLSSEKAIKNPYYGSSMLTCGNVVGTIK
ncbi:DUF3347 domain-containing protein [Pedobacter frigoris]|uniref:DUF3347 domain-containing protein n=1 Tax=Pedobacter frigoris TaxID=2571272 RepID=UPI00292DD13B|nr:DUF3347 domain-containing protein [Pedobacter frigoris]